VIDDRGIAIYVADIVYRSDAIKLHIDLLAGTRAARPSASRRRAEKSHGAQGAVPTTRVLRGCN
jgi:GntR family transcriptional regulator